MSTEERVQFDDWFQDNQEFLESNTVSKEVAEIIWHSAMTASTHNITAAIQSGTLRIVFT
jgi:hypothetical protein